MAKKIKRLKRGKGVISTIGKALAGAFIAKKGYDTFKSVKNRVGNFTNGIIKAIKDKTGITARNRTKRLNDDSRIGMEMKEYLKKQDAPLNKPTKTTADVKGYAPKYERSGETQLDDIKKKLGLPHKTAMHQTGWEPRRGPQYDNPLNRIGKSNRSAYQNAARSFDPSDGSNDVYMDSLEQFSGKGKACGYGAKSHRMPNGKNGIMIKNKPGQFLLLNKQGTGLKKIINV